MFIQDKTSRICRRIIFIMISTLIFTQIQAKIPGYSFLSSKNLKIKILQDKNIDFIHAQILIYNRAPVENKAIPYLTYLNIFNRDLYNKVTTGRSDTDVFNIIKKLGNDCTVEYRTDFVLIKINFLPDSFELFTSLLKKLFSYKSFTLKKFNESIKDYWLYFFKQKEWKNNIADQIAYNKLFEGHFLGNTLFGYDLIKKINLAQIRSYYQQNYIFSNAYLIIKGNLNPHISFGKIVRAFKSFKVNELKYDPIPEPEITNSNREIVIFNINNGQPTIYWYEIVPAVNHQNYIPSLIVNEILFGHPPIGRLYRNARHFSIKNLRLSTSVRNHKNVSVIRNCIKLNYKDLERFILLADNEKRKLRIAGVNRKEYIKAKNYFYGKFKVESADFKQLVDYELLNYFTGNKNSKLQQPLEKIQKINLTNINQLISASDPGNIKDKVLKKTVIIIVGNSKLILKDLKILKPEIIELR